MTVATCVCCSMISASQIRYASRVPLPRQIVAAVRALPRGQARRERAGGTPGRFAGLDRGGKRRECLRVTAGVRAVARGDGAARRRSAQRIARRCRRLAGGLGLRVLRDQFLERAARRRAVAQLELAGRDVEQRVGHFLAVGKRGDQLPLRWRSPRGSPSARTARCRSNTAPTARAGSSGRSSRTM